MRSYEVDVDTVAVRVVLLGGSAHQAELFLRRDSSHHRGPELVLERLSEPDQPFLPLRIDGRTTLFRRAGIAYVERRERAPELEALEELGAIHFPVELDVETGETFVGELLALLPEPARRLSDLLNHPEGGFLALAVDGGTLYVNRSAIVRVHERESTAGDPPG